MTLVALASEVEYGVLHFLDEDGELVCVGSFGFGALATRQLDETSGLSSSALRGVVTSRRPAASATSAPPWAGSSRCSVITGFGSLVVVPVLAGGSVYGCLSLASTVDYEFSAPEVGGFTSIATGIGFAIQNHRSVHAAALTTVSYAEIGLAITGVEVAQAARHEARGLIDDCLVATVILGQEARKVAPGPSRGHPGAIGRDRRHAERSRPCGRQDQGRYPRAAPGALAHRSAGRVGPGS